MAIGNSGNSINISSANVGIPVVNDQLVASFGSIALGSNLATQNVVQIPNYKNLDISSITLQLSVTSTTSTSAPTGVAPIEAVIKSLELQSINGKDIWRPLDGSLGDISNYARYLNSAGVVNNSPLFPTGTSTTVTTTWNINIPFGINRKHFPLKLFTTFNTLASTATTLNTMTVTVSTFNVLASYHDIKPADVMLKPLSVGVAATGTPSFQQYYDQGHVYYQQILVYGNVQSPYGTTATDAPIGNTGTGITDTPDGGLYISNSPLQAFIQKENNTFPNTVSAGVGHETGMVNLFTNPFVATAASQLSINFTSTPSVANNTQTLRLLMVESL